MTAVDSSVLVAGFATWHEWHGRARDVLDERPAVVAHAAFETFSVLTRLPERQRVAPEIAVRFLGERFQEPWLTLPPDRQRDLLFELTRSRIVGGGVYDALIGATAAYHEHELVTLDRRAGRVYEALGVRSRLLG